VSVEGWKTLFDWFTVILLFLTFAAGAGVLITGNIINKRQEGQLRQFDKDLTGAKTELGKQQERAANADARVAGLEQDVANAKTEMARQQTRAANAEKNLLELQQTLADRTLSDEQVESIVGELKEFSGQEYQVVAYWDSKESMNIANRISQALQLAKWKLVPLERATNMMGEVVGVMVWLHPNADERTKKAADSLVSVLLRERLHAEIRFQNPNNPQSNKLSLSVGAKR
jgi:septal ring factor EnvC (AmiA/AmiB activator)